MGERPDSGNGIQEMVQQDSGNGGKDSGNGKPGGNAENGLMCTYVLFVATTARERDILGLMVLG